MTPTYSCECGHPPGYVCEAHQSDERCPRCRSHDPKLRKIGCFGAIVDKFHDKRSTPDAVSHDASTCGGAESCRFCAAAEEQRPTTDAAMIERVRLDVKYHEGMDLDYISCVRTADLRALYDAVERLEELVEHYAYRCLKQLETVTRERNDCLRVQIEGNDAAQPDGTGCGVKDNDGLVGKLRADANCFCHVDPDNCLTCLAAAEIEALLKVGKKLNKRAIEAEQRAEKAEVKMDKAKRERDEWLDAAARNGADSDRYKAERDELRSKLKEIYSAVSALRHE